MEKTLQDSPTTKMSNADAIADASMATDAGFTIFRQSEMAGEIEESVANMAADVSADTSSDATMPITNAAADFSLGEYSFAEEIELATKEPVKIDADHDLMESLSSVPQKMAFKIGEVAEMLGVKQYVLRYWETEFEALRPKKSKNNQRVYTRREVETAMLIKKLLYKDRFSIEGARAALKSLRGQVKEERNWKAVAQGQHKVADRLQALIGDIRKLHDSLA